MDGRRETNPELLAETLSVGERTTTEDGNDRLELRTWLDLPEVLLESIMSRLPLADNIRASAACRSWQKVAISVRNQSAWLMYFPKSGNLYEFYDPSERNTHSLELPELCGSRVCYSKDGWLLLFRNDLVFFFNPFTRKTIELPKYDSANQVDPDTLEIYNLVPVNQIDWETIELPKLDLTNQAIAFSCAPTSTNCLVFTIKQLDPLHVAISTCHPGASDWTTANYESDPLYASSFFDKLVFCNGAFYCLCSGCSLGVYDTQAQTWAVPVRPRLTFFDILHGKQWWKGNFLTEHNGDVLLIHTRESEEPRIFRVDQLSMEWEMIDTLDGATLFASFFSSFSGTDLPGIMRNSVLFSKLRYFGKRCISFCLDGRGYYCCNQQSQQSEWGEEDPFENIWIQPPKNASSLF